MTKLVTGLTVALCFCTAVAADSWTEKDHVRTWRFVKGSFGVDVVNDAQSRYEARRYVRITRGAQVVATFERAGFDILAASPDETLFVGLSNDGLDGTAVLIFDRKGKVLLEAAHWPGSFDYCEESITLFKVWHGSEPKDVHFEKGNAPDGITVLDCHVNRVNLLQTVSEAVARGRREPGEPEAVQVTRGK